MSAPRPQVLLKIAELGFHYGQGTWSMAGLGLELRAGELLGLIGPSGCGKSSLLQLILGLYKPQSGVIRWESGGIPPRPGVVFQRPRLLPWLSAVQNAAYGLRCQDVARAESLARAEQLLRRAGLGECLHHPPARLSGGEQQRVALARALLINPPLLLLDEPFSSLDAPTRRDLHRLLRDELRQRQLSCLLISHDLEEVAGLADRVLLMGGQPARIIGEQQRPEPADAHADDADKESPAALLRRYQWSRTLEDWMNSMNQPRRLFSATLESQ